MDRFRQWAEEEPTVRAALVVGSQARSGAPADEWSDLDIVLFSSSPEELITSRRWIERFGDVLVTEVEPTAVGGGRERRVVYSGGRDVDFAVFPCEALGSIASSPDTLEALRRGFDVLLDKDGRLRQLPAMVGRAVAGRSTTPSAGEFRDCVEGFWYHVLWAAKKLGRGELWTAKMACDGFLKHQVLRMAEWRALIEGEGRVDVWHDGRFLDRWAPPDLLRRLPETFARYDRADIARALDATARLFSDQGRRVAADAGLDYPMEVESAISALVTPMTR